MNSIQNPELVELIKKYIRNWKLFAVSFVCCIGLAGAYLLIKNPQFKMAANVLIKEDSKGGMGSMAATMMKNMGGFGDMLGVGGGSVDDEVEIISSYSILYEAAKELGLNVTYLEKKMLGLKNKHHYKDSPIEVKSDIVNMPDTFLYAVDFRVKVDKDENVKVVAKYKRKKIGEAKSKFPVHIKTTFGDFTLNKTAYFNENKKLSMRILFEGYGSTTEELQKKVTIDVASKKANVIGLEVRDVIQKRGIDLLNSIIARYNEYGIEEKNIEASRTAMFLQQRIDLMDAELKGVELQLENYKTKNQLTDIDTEAQIILEKNSDFKEQLIKTETQFTVISMIEEFLQAPENRYAVVPMSLGIEEKSAVESLLKYNELLLERLKLLRSTNPGNPMIESMNEQVDATRLSVLVTIQSIKRGIEYARNDLRMQEKTFMERIKGMPLQEREYVEIRRQQEIKQALFIFLLQQKEETALRQAVANPKAQIIDHGFAFNKPVAPKKLLVAAVALLFAVLLPMLFLYFRRLFAEKYETVADFQEIAGNLKLSGVIHHSAIEKPFQDKESVVIEDFRRLRSDVLNLLKDKTEHQSVLVASILRGEGVSFVAYNLALSLAKSGKHVLLVDANMRFSGYSGTGVYDVVANNADVNRSILSEEVNLDILPSGKCQNDSAEILLNPRFIDMMDQLKQRYDVVIMDSLALSDFSDTMPLSEYADGIVFVSRAGSSKKAVAYLESFVEGYGYGAKSICILNGLRK